MNFLEVAGQQLPENFTFNSAHLNIPNSYFSSNFKIIRGEITGYNRLQTTSGIVGTTDSDSAYTTFTPLVPFDFNTLYTIVCDDKVFVSEISQPPAQEPIQIVAVYPSVKQVPSNILKWYIRFSKPVNPIKIYDRIDFLDNEGNAIDRSILHLDAPLLSPDGTLLTVWVEPGRQKQLLGPNRHLGSVFDSSKEYTLRIDGNLKDADGMPIKASVNHTFTTVEADRKKPTLSQWQIKSLEAGSLSPLEIKVGEQLDFGSLSDAFYVTLNGQQVEGDINFHGETMRIIFTPHEKWIKGSYTINVETTLEDLAGNNLLHLFDRPIVKEQGDRKEKVFTLSVECF